MKFQHYLRLLGDPSVKQYLKSLIKTGDIRLFSKVVRAALKGKRRQILPGLKALLEESHRWPQPTTWHRILPLLPLTSEKGSWESIELASRSCSFSLKDTEWSTIFQDPEDSMALHRFGWVLQGLLQEKRVPWFLVTSWMEWFFSKDTSLPSAALDSYSVAERICNFCMMILLDSPEESLLKNVLKTIHQDTIFLTNHLEYYGPLNTNNHILNNARALIFSGSLLGNKNFFNVGRDLLLSEIRSHCSEDGVFREASSHYQWVITRWMVEIALLFNYQQDPQATLFNNNVLKMLEICDHFSLGDENQSYIPLIGDVSPDFPPSWYKGLTETSRALLKGKQNNSSNLDGWASLFKSGDRPQKTASSYSWISKQGDWLKIKNENWSLLAHVDTTMQKARMSHGHQDNFSFELAWKGFPVIIDRGRKDYMSSITSSSSSILDEWHNSIIIDNHRLGFRPRSFMDQKWLKKNISIPLLKIKNNSASLNLTLPPKLINQVESIERIWALEPFSTFITTRIQGKGSHQLQLFLYLPTTDYQINSPQSFEFKIAEMMRVNLTMDKLSTPKIEASEWYPTYGKASPCIRLVWSQKIILPWESTWTLSHD